MKSVVANGIFYKLKEVYKVLSRIDPDVIHSQLWASNFLSRLVNVLLKKSIVITEQNIYHNRTLKKKISNRVLSWGTSQFVAVSEGVKDYLIEQESISPSKICVIPNAICFDKFDLSKSTYIHEKLGINSDTRVLCNVGALTEQKSQDVLIKGYAKLNSDFPVDVHLVIIGDGYKKEELMNLINSLDLQDRVHLLGWRSDVPKILNSCSLFVFPSKWEGLPLALLEAVAAELPVIASDIKPHREIIEDGETGILVPTEEPAQLAEEVENLLENPTHAESLATNARERLEERYDISQVAKRYERLFQNLVE